MKRFTALCALAGLLAGCGGGDPFSTLTGQSSVPVAGHKKIGPPTKQTDTVTVTVGGAGSVISNPAGLSCSGGTTGCSASFPAGTTVTLDATASSGDSFAGWTGACSGSATSCTLTLNASANVGASFAPAVQTDTLTVSVGGSGAVTSSPAGINCGAGSTACTQSFASGALVTLTAAAASGYAFSGWSGACSGTTASCAVTMSTAQSAGATFAASSSSTAHYLISDAYPLADQQPNHFDVACDSGAWVTSPPAVNPDGTSYLHFDVSSLASGSHSCSVTAANASNQQTSAVTASFTL